MADYTHNVFKKFNPEEWNKEYCTIYQTYHTYIEDVNTPERAFSFLKQLRYYEILGLKIIRQFISQKENGNKNLKILDIGCGFGKLANLLACIYPKHRVLGLDLCKYAIKKANNIKNVLHLKNIRFVCTAFENFGFQNRGFDIILLFEILEHVYDLDNFLSKIKPICEKGELIIGSVPFERDRISLDHVREFTVESLEAILMKHFSINIVNIRPYILFYGSSQNFDKELTI